MDLDFYLFSSINNLAGRSAVLDFLGLFLAKYLGWLIVIFLFVLFIQNFRRNWFWFFGAAISGILSRLVVVELIRLFFYQPRPFVLYSVNLLLEHSPSASFPSGHAAFYFAVSAFVWLWFQKNKPCFPGLNVGILLIAFSILMSLARIFGGVHWPSDILAGASVGILVAVFIFYIFNKFFTPRQSRELS